MYNYNKLRISIKGQIKFQLLRFFFTKFEIYVFETFQTQPGFDPIEQNLSIFERIYGGQKFHTFQTNYRDLSVQLFLKTESC